MHTLVLTVAVCASDTSTYNYSQTTGALGNFTYLWSMIASANACPGAQFTGCGWMQSGYFMSFGHSRVHFAQIWNYQQWNGIPQNKVGAVVASGEIHQYWQQYAPDAQGEFHSNVDQTRFINTATGLLTHGWTGYSQQFDSETRYKQSDVPGSASYHAPLYNLQVQRVSDGVFQNIPNPFLQTSDNGSYYRWHTGPTSATSFDVWTNPIQ